MANLVERVIDPPRKSLGGFSVRRALPAPERQMIGPFIFFDHLGPVRFAAGEGIDVRPHPHIHLATVTYLFEGALLHRDSLGFVQEIRPGDVNWMTAGRGIVHSERTPPAERAAGHAVHAIQSWVALPQASQEREPCFRHHPQASLPTLETGGARLRLIAGSALGASSPVEVFSPLFYLDAQMPRGSAVPLAAGLGERGVYVASGELSLGGERYGEGRLLVLAPDVDVRVEAAADTRAMLFGGAALDGERHLWWNFVSSDPARIEQAKADWRDGRFGTVPGETEFIPLPER